MDIQTDRLILRRWRDSDIAPFIDLCRDADVMKYFVKPRTRDETIASVAHIRQHFKDHGYGVWAVEVRGVAGFIGFIGLQVPDFEAHFTPCVEIGWRLAKQHWRQGYASEGALAVLRHGFDEVGLHEIVSMTVPSNTPSRGVMEKIGMIQDVDGTFQHPCVPDGHPFKTHVLYRASPSHLADISG